MARCGLLGRNIQYSRSPDIHNQYYSRKNVHMTYELFDINEDKLQSFINSLDKNNILGFNVTIPYKQAIIKYLDRLVYPADRIGAVNTVVLDEEGLTGYNTDYYGFKNSLKDYNLDLSGKEALILGAGGAAKCVSFVLEDLRCSKITAAVRNIDKAKEVFGERCRVLTITDVNDLLDYDIIVNCTPLGGVNYESQLPVKLNGIKEGCIAYDLVYKPEKTLFLKRAEELGAFIINGESMLYHQAYKAADIWIDKLNNKY